MFSNVNPLMEQVTLVLEEQEFRANVTTAMGILESNGIHIPSDISVEDFGDALVAAAKFPELALDEADFLSKVGNAARRIAMAYGKAKGKAGAARTRWQDFKASVTRAKELGQAKGKRSYEVGYQAKHQATRTNAAAMKAASKSRKLKPGEKMVFGKVVNIGDARKKKAALPTGGANPSAVKKAEW